MPRSIGGLKVLARVFTVVVGLVLVVALVRTLPQDHPAPSPGSGQNLKVLEAPLANRALRRPPKASTVMREPGVGTSPARRPGQELFDGSRAGARKAVPVTRGQELGFRFRPDERDPMAGQAYPGRAEQGAGGRFTSSESSQFRPLPKARRRTYEDIEAENRAAEPPVPPTTPYPMLPMPPMGPGYWR